MKQYYFISGLPRSGSTLLSAILRQNPEFYADIASPVEGNIILFPSYLPHSVETNDHDEERISISFNLIALPKGSVNYPTQNNE